MSKTILITGASSGIGGASARIFAKNGYRLILNARRKERLKDLKRELETEFKSDILLLPFDVRDQKNVESEINNLPQEWKEIDVLLNNAGGVFSEFSLTEDGYEKTIATNHLAYFVFTLKLLPIINKEQGRPSPP